MRWDVKHDPHCSLSDKMEKNAYGFNWVIITTILLKQHKITAFDASSQVQTTVVVCCQIVEVQVDLGNKLIRRTCLFFFVSSR